ncbi:two-component system OmpR family sensor kinase [Pseudochelatococcus lubricantis]|uniref:histidine kinase n=1 Tax=Pseudochelatococcus lubricantis TaxID=1538102 RepID=A0ABX0V6A2_9HYPH|nr:ATP-binding protein [Pseudochelatococcus lubricantis]NIJ59850.1 two-component system OmpR family sensor kinase [Pseudochelatococcus lubricantis]
MPLRVSLIIAFSVVFTILGVASAVYGHVSARREVWDVLDLQQRQIAQLIGDGSGVFSDHSGSTDLSNEDGYAVEVRFADGRASRVSRADVDFPETIVPGFSTFDTPSGEWRVFTLIGEQRVVRVAQMLAERQELAENAAWNAALPILVAIPLSWGVVWALVGAILGRLRPLIEQVERRTAEETEPVELGDGPAELRPLVDAMNLAFARQRAAAEQQKQFVSDAAHELRTPLTALSLQIENLRHANRDPALDGPLTDATSGIRRASALTSRLLQLARQEARATVAAPAEVRLDDIAVRVIGSFFASAQAKNIDLGTKASEPTIVRGDEADLVALVEILVDNAVRYTPAGGTIDLTIRKERELPLLIVEDTGPGIPEDAIELVFERFYRVDEAQGEGAGLGLAIARVISARHGATIALENRRDQTGLRATVHFP